MGRTVAVALNHEFDSDSVPQVVASGRGFVADQILNFAFEHGVKVRQDSDLAEILSAVDIEEEIRLKPLQPLLKYWFTFTGRMGWRLIWASLSEKLLAGCIQKGQHYDSDNTNSP